MTVRLFEEKDAPAWNDYVRRSAAASCYHLIAWKDVIEESFHHPAWYLLSENKKNEIDGTLPIVQMKSALFGNFMVSLPYFNYGGIVADNEAIRDELYRSAVDIAQNSGATHIELRHTQEFNGLRVKKEKVSMRLALPEKNEELWKSFPAKLRSQIRRALKEGMRAAIGREEELESFYTVFSENMRDLGTPVYAKAFFKNILRHIPASWICTVYTKTNKPVSSAILIGFKGILEIPWASSLKHYNRLGPNMLLYWTSLKFACDHGFKFFDFGRCTPGEGTFKFKEQWGARPVQLYWHYWMKNGDPLPELNPKNPRYSAAIRIWKRLPVLLTKLIGPAIVKNLP